MIDNTFSKNLNKLIYLGPRGSYSDAAKNKFIEEYTLTTNSIPCNSISEVIRILIFENSSHTAAVIPIENSIEGIVRETVDNLAELSTHGIYILSELHFKIEHSLISHAKNKSEIKTISSHPQALAQCRKYIYSNWNDDIQTLATLSTSAAVSSLSESVPQNAAIGSEYCANLYNIPILEKGINDEKNNTTRFILLGKALTQKDTCSKTSITFSTENKPGALNKILKILEDFSLNMSYIDSRPSRKQLGEYVFYIDFEGHISDENVKSALNAVKKCTGKFEILGSYDVIN